jgi:MoaA/NifB/PqqE/SkfB family radical SAM enzyme
MDNGGGMKTLSIHLTDLCDSQCVFCVVDAPRRVADSIAPERIRQVLLENAACGYTTLNLHGGEPAVHEDFLAVLRLAKGLGYPRVHLQTNGRALRNFAFVEQLRDLNVELFIVSVHGASAAVHDSLTQSPGAFDAVRSAIGSIKRANGRVQTNTVAVKPNLSELPETVDWVLDAGVDHVNISCLHPAGMAFRNFDLLAPSLAETQTWLPRAAARAIGRNSPLTLEGFPMCAIPGYERYHLGRRPGTIHMEFRGSSIMDYDRFMEERCRLKGPDCASCAHNGDCAGVYLEYAMKRGWGEFRPVQPAGG